MATVFDAQALTPCVTRFHHSPNLAKVMIKKTVLILFVSILLTSCGNLIKNGAIVEAQQALDRSAYADALESTDIAETFGDLSAVETARLYYLRAQALEGLGRQEDAIATYQYVIDQHGNSPYANLSRKKLDTL